LTFTSCPDNLSGLGLFHNFLPARAKDSSPDLTVTKATMLSFSFGTYVFLEVEAAAGRYVEAEVQEKFLVE